MYNEKKMIVIPLKIHIIMTINEIKIVKCQSFCRGWLARKKNIYCLIRKFKGLKSTFDAVINGYHMINKAPIKESVWEEINCDIVKIN